MNKTLVGITAVRFALVALLQNELRQQKRQKHPRWTLVDVASAGMPRDGDQRAVYAVLTWEHGAWRIEHHRVRFDIEAVARDYAAVGYPDAQQAAPVQRPGLGAVLGGQQLGREAAEEVAQVVADRRVSEPIDRNVFR